LPFVLTNVLGVSNVDPDGGVPSSVIWSFYIGGGMLLLSVIWTVFRTKEYPPEEYAEYKGLEVVSKEKKEKGTLMGFFKLLKDTPKTMMQLAVVQFFSWFALYLMWVYTTYALAQHSWGCSVDDVSSKSFQDAGDWVGILFGGYSLFAALFSIVMSKLATRFGRKNVYSMSLLLGGIGYLSTYFFSGGELVHLNLLITEVDVPSSASLWLFSMVGVGIAWAAILAMPYSILSDSLPADKMGVYMGIFNFTIAGPQIISGIIAGEILRYFFDGEAIFIMIIAGVSMLLGAISVAFVKQNKAVKL